MERERERERQGARPDACTLKSSVDSIVPKRHECARLGVHPKKMLASRSFQTTALLGSAAEGMARLLPAGGHPRRTGSCPGPNLVGAVAVAVVVAVAVAVPAAA